MLQGAAEWLSGSPRKAVLKIGDIKFMACPLSTITAQSWQVLALVNDCTDSDGNLLNLPFAGAVTDQPEWFREAVRIVRTERAAWRKKQADEVKRGTGKR